MRSLGFQLFLFFFLADVALFAMLAMPEEGYTFTPAVIASEASPRTDNRGFISAAPSPRAKVSADTARPAVRYLPKQKKLD